MVERFLGFAIAVLFLLCRSVDGFGIQSEFPSAFDQHRCTGRVGSRPIDAAAWGAKTTLFNSHSTETEMPNALSRRHLLMNLVPTAMCILYPAPALSAEPIDSVKAIRDAFQGVRDELLNTEGGVSVLSKYVDQQDYGNIMEFTKTYDQILRKGKMGKAKKLLLSYLEDNEILKKRIGERATQIANAITFDLIGLNRSSRSGQESAVDASKYLDELQSDLLEFLALEDELLPS